MQINNCLSAFVLCCVLYVFVGCGGASTNKNLNPTDFDWSKSTSFKYDFNSANNYVQELKRADLDLIGLILDGVDKGEIEAFHFYDKKQMSKAEIDHLFHPKDTVSVFDIDAGKEILKPTVGELNRASIKRVRMEQEWFFDKATFNMQSRVKAIIPMQTIFNTDGSERGDVPLFLVYFK